MGTLKVRDNGLAALAAQCTAIASRLASEVPTPAAGPPTQATTAAVGSAYTALEATSAVLAARIHTMARKLEISGSQYVGADNTSAQQLSELTGGPGRE